MTARPQDIEGRDPPPRLFIRDDDVGDLTPALCFFAETFLERELPVSYQIIPARLTTEAASYLLDLHKAKPRLIEFGQHGHTHEMTVRGRHSWREFGPERSEAEQAAAIEAGAAILRDRLAGAAAVRVFTPPQHKYDASTVRAAAAAGHRIFSGSSYPSLRHRLAYRLGRMMGLGSLRHHGISYHPGRRPEAAIAELSISIAVDDGGNLLATAHRIPAMIARAARITPIVGLMFHHELYRSDERRSALVEIADALAAMGPDLYSLMEPLALASSQAGPPRGSC